MKILVAYYSESGNTEKVARAIHGEAGREHDGELLDIRSLDLENMDYDLVFLGSPVHSSDIAPIVRDTMSRFPEDPGFRLAGFVTHAAPRAEDIGSEEVFDRWVGKAESSFEAICHEKGIGFIGFFNCQGVATPDIKTFIREHVYAHSEEGFNSYIEKAENHPDEADLDNAREFAGRIISEQTDK
jgi:flavodoxin